MDKPMGTDPMDSRISTARRMQPEERGGGADHFAAPLGSATSGRLLFTNGAHRVAVRAHSDVPGLYRARFGDRMPTMVGVRGGLVIIRYPRAPYCDWLNCRSERPAEVALNAGILWDIEVRGGASRLVADLRGLCLGSLNVYGGASRLEVVLSAPTGTVPVVIRGGASNVAIRRPNEVAARLRVDGGATNLKFDDRRIGAAGGELDLGNRGYNGATDRYDITITGGANNVSIDKQRGIRGRSSGASV